MKKYSFIILTLLALHTSWARPDTTAHLLIQDTSNGRWAAMRLFLAESLQTTNLGSYHRQSSTWAQLIAYGEVNPEWSWKTRIKVFTDIGNRYYSPNDYQPSNGIPYNVQDSLRRTWDFSTATSEYKLSERAKLTAGLDYLTQGPAYRNPLAFRGDQSIFRPWDDTLTNIYQPAPLLFFGWDLGLKWIDYTQQSGISGYQRGKSRYFHTHNLTATLPMKSELSLFETVLYGSTIEPAGSNPNHNADSVDRDFGWIYAMPFVPYYFAQHYNGDRDNASMGLSGVFGGLPHTSLYFEFLVDDSKTPTSFFDDSWWGNKWALSTGWQWFAQTGSWKHEWRFEWTRVEPWVYTHHQGASHQYTNYGQLLGTDLGPNSQEFYSHYQVEHGQLLAKVSVSAVDKDDAFGSHVQDIHKPTDPTTKKFLAPATTKHYLELGAEARYTFWKMFWVRVAGYRYQGDYDGYRVESSSGVTW